MTEFNGKALLICVLATVATACSKDTDDSDAYILSTESTVVESSDAALSESSQWTETADLNSEDAKDLTTAPSPTEIPYPLYPNGSRYRIGGEGGLRIVLFQTEDSFEEVDAFYQKEARMPRLSAMSDYVRYSSDKNDIDPWETSKPGIVIHQFNDESERAAVGADNSARTNIIMSF